jgi:formate--tetrahydrofolate ligase
VKEKIKEFNKYKYPICVAKTQYSISDDPKKLGYPKDYEVTIRDIKVNNGSKFIVIYLGDIITMPGLSKNPSALEIKIKNDVIYLPR